MFVGCNCSITFFGIFYEMTITLGSVVRDSVTGVTYYLRIDYEATRSE